MFYKYILGRVCSAVWQIKGRRQSGCIGMMKSFLDCSKTVQGIFLHPPSILCHDRIVCLKVGVAFPHVCIPDINSNDKKMHSPGSSTSYFKTLSLQNGFNFYHHYSNAALERCDFSARSAVGPPPKGGLDPLGTIDHRLMDVAPPPPQGEGQRAAEGCEYITIQQNPFIRLSAVFEETTHHRIVLSFSI